MNYLQISIIIIIIINYAFSWNVNYFKFQQNWEF